MFLSPYSLTPTRLNGAEVGRGTGKGGGTVWKYITLQAHFEMHMSVTRHCKHTLSLTHTGKSTWTGCEVTRTKKEEGGKRTLAATDTHIIFNADKQTHRRTQSSPPSRCHLAASPSQGCRGRFASAGTAQRSVTGETAMLCFCHQRWWQRNCLCNAPGSFPAH